MKLEVLITVSLFFLLGLVFIDQRADSSAVNEPSDIPIEEQIFGTQEHQDMRPPNSCVLVCR
jgi:hypothetical protein